MAPLPERQTQAQPPAIRRETAVEYESRGEKIHLTPGMVRNFLVTGKKELITDQEIYYFMAICKARHLNPFVKDCYLIKYGSDPAAIIVSIDYYRARAKAQPDCVGWEKGVIVVKENGEMRYSQGIVLPGETLVGGWFRATPKGWTNPLVLEVNLDGYIKKKDGHPTQFWAPEKQPSQIMKVAESQGLRTAWPDEFGGMLTGEEAGLDLEKMGSEPGKVPPPSIEMFVAFINNHEFKVDIDEEALFNQYLIECAKGLEMENVTELKASINTQEEFDSLMAMFEKWKSKRSKASEKPKAETKEKPKADTTKEPTQAPQGITEEQRVKLYAIPDPIYGEILTMLGVPYMPPIELDYSTAEKVIAESVKK